MLENQGLVLSHIRGQPSESSLQSEQHSYLNTRFTNNDASDIGGGKNWGHFSSHDGVFA